MIYKCSVYIPPSSWEYTLIPSSRGLIILTFVSKKLSKSIGAINRIKSLLPHYILHSLYSTMIYPHLTYCNLVWGRACHTLLQLLLTLQKRVLRIIMHAHYQAPSSPLFYQLSILKIHDIQKLLAVHYMFKMKFCILPDNNLRMFDICSSHHYNTRANNYFVFGNGKSSFMRKNISYYGPRLWDSLPVTTQFSSYYGLLTRLTIDHLLSLYVS
jgi:hypothetical protein